MGQEHTGCYSHNRISSAVLCRLNNPANQYCLRNVARGEVPIMLFDHARVGVALLFLSGRMLLAQIASASLIRFYQHPIIRRRPAPIFQMA